jgi:hypothetical protein
MCLFYNISIIHCIKKIANNFFATYYCVNFNVISEAELARCMLAVVV